MAKKASNVVKHLQSARFAESEPDLFRQIVARLPKDWASTRGFEFAAGMALRVDLASSTLAPVAQLFKIVNLDPEIPWHWPVLLRLIAWAIQEDSRGPGAGKKWTPRKWQTLREDLKSLKSTKNRSLAAKHLRKRFPDKYAKWQTGYLRKLVKHALVAEESATSLLPTMPKASGETIGDTINLIVAAIETEIDEERALNALAKRDPNRLHVNPPSA
jgi:hypothetical protein